jgi:hypothetical protein
MNRSALCAATLIALGFSANAAFAVAIPYSDNFSGIPTNALNTAPSGWVSLNGSVDSIVSSNPYGISCFSGGCVDLDGTTSQSGIFEKTGTFTLVGGQTYALSAEVSGNQRTSTPNTLEFGFIKGGTPIPLPLQSATITGIAENSPFTLYTVLYKPLTTTTATVFFYDVGGTNDQGPILDNVSLTAVPLPAAAWLMLSGLAALGAVARRRMTGATA